MKAVITMEKSRVLLFYIYSVLKQYSDETHPLNSTQILRHLEMQYQIQINRGTLYHHIQALQDYGIDIKNAKCINDGKYLVDRQLEKSEVFLLINAIHSAHFIPASQSKQLIEKLMETQSIYFQKEYRYLQVIHNRKKSPNKAFFLNIEVILDAIDKKCAVTFYYMHYTVDKKMKCEDQKLHIVYPIHIVTENGNTYLIGSHKRHNDSIIHYRVDKITRIQLLEHDVDTTIKRDFDPYTYTSTKPFMFGGAAQRVILRCHLSILDDVIDLFGNEIMIIPYRNQPYFDVSVSASRQGIIYFALQYLKYCELLEQTDIREEIKEILASNMKKYQVS